MLRLGKKGNRCRTSIAESHFHNARIRAEWARSDCPLGWPCQLDFLAVQAMGKCYCSITTIKNSLLPPCGKDSQTQNKQKMLTANFTCANSNTKLLNHTQTSLGRGHRAPICTNKGKKKRPPTPPRTHMYTQNDGRERQKGNAWYITLM